jgi:hypothetical protein
LLITAITVVLFTGCHKKEVRTQLRQVRYLQARLDSIHKVYKDIDMAEFKKIEKKIYATFDVVKSHDTNIAIPDSVYFSTFGVWADAGKGINRMFRKKIPGIETDLNLTNKQLKSLKHDIARNLLPADSIPVFINDESEAVNRLVTDISLVNSEMERCASIYKKHKSEVEQFINSIEKK